ncbi:protein DETOXIFICATION 16-like isoform X4 [Magnolia sinica]|uniref:protein DETOXIFICATION 16-like isoform X4 n=1 Tax=Magnolia sinica TaxID=86752 RepID=UPI002658ABD7|nr:protein DETOXIFICATION 16-like isoform X4 [Magnolia sinica]
MEGDGDGRSSLQSPLLQSCSEKGIELESGRKREEILGEIKKQLLLAGPLIAINLLQFSLRMISVMFVGHLGELALSSASMATSFGGVTGFILLMGMGSALDTLCGQAYGAKQYHMLGIHMQRAMIVLAIVSIPISFIWAYTGQILVALGQDPMISMEAGLYARWMIPSIFAYGLLQCHVRFLQTQNIVIPMMISTGITVLLHVAVCWVLVFKSGLGNKGAALAIGISYWVNVALLAIYVNFSSACKKTWTGLSKEALNDILKFLRLAVPSALMVCLEVWSFELIVLLSGLLPNPKLETSVLSISLNTCSMVYMIPFGLSSAISTRVSNELGAGRPQAARLAVCVVVVMAISLGAVLGLATILVRNVWGYVYSNEVEVVKYVATLMPLIALSDFLDGIQSVLSGTARGCGWQKTGALINLGAFYIVGIPTSVLLAFFFHVGGKARKAKDRVNSSSIPINT